MGGTWAGRKLIYPNSIGSAWTIGAITGRCLGSGQDRKSTRLNSSHSQISYAVFCLKKKEKLHRLTLDIPTISIVVASVAIAAARTGTVDIPPTSRRSCDKALTAWSPRHVRHRPPPE